MKTSELQAAKKLLITLIIFVVVVISWDKLIGKAITSYIKYRRLNTFSGLEYAEKIKADVLIFGASQVEVGCNSKLISTKTSYSAVTLSQGASNTTYSYIILKEYLKRHKPKYVILGVSSNDLHDNERVLTSIKLLRHLYGTDSGIDSLISSEIPHTRLSLFFDMYRYNRLILDILKNRTIDNATDRYMPYTPDNGKTLTSIIKQFESNPDGAKQEVVEAKNRSKVDTASISYKTLNSFLDLCRDNQVKVIMFYGPYYQSDDLPYDMAPMPDYFRTMPTDDFVSFHHISNRAYPYLKDKKYFHDIAHLNSLGADSLSTILSGFIIDKQQN